MTDVFLSYNRKDEARVTPIIDGLRGAGLSVWWDRDIAGGADWRQLTLEQLEAARCVMVVWSETSAGPRGEFVQDEAGRGKARGVLIPVRIDHITEPLGFGAIQSIDLVGWRGSPKNWRFKNLIAAAKAVVAGEPRPRPMTPGRRARLLAAWASGFTAVAAVLGFTTNLVGLQMPLCKIPGLHAVCASWGLGGVPTKDEKALWSKRVAGDCEGLRAYLERFPKGVFADEADRMLQAAETREEENWTPEEHRLPLTVLKTPDPLATEEAARADALTRGANEAGRTCRSYKSGGLFRLVSATVEAQSWRCSARGSGSVCSFDGEAICQVEARHVTQRQVCK